MKRIVTKTDIKIIIFVILMWITSIFIAFFALDNGNEKAVIYVNGRQYASYVFKDIEEKEILTINNLGENVIEITKNGVKVLESDCKDKTEIRDDYINKSYQSLVCLPHRLVIKIEGGGEDIDEITY
ncbi:MAG: NusG domain II-containing protein [Ruminococcaceae bacterium]|nr:NusG domain II-containing protein [Oscillospiraceae bacterium]